MSGFHLGVTFAFLGVCLCIVASQHVCFIGTVYSKDVGSLRWVLPYEDPCVCTAIQLGGHLPYKHATGHHYLEGPFLSEDSGDIHKFFGCPGICDKDIPLGVEHGTPLLIEDGNFTASSIDQDGSWYSSASSARLNYKGNDNGRRIGSLGGWKPQDNQHTDSWIEVDLGRDVMVSGIITQGRDGEGDGSGTQVLFWVTQFKVMYRPSKNSNLLCCVKSTDAKEMFNGNTAAYNTQVTNFFLEPVLAFSIRICPVAWERKVTLRFELLGCLITPLSKHDPYLEY